MRIYLWILSFVLALTAGAQGAEIRFDFNDTATGALPTNFIPVLEGKGAPCNWQIAQDEISSSLTLPPGQRPMATHHGVLAQTSADPTDERYPMLLFTGEKFRNFKFTARFKIVSGVTEQIAGLVFRYQNPTNYYVIRASALGTNICFYKVVNGDIVSPFKLPHVISTNTWHTLEVDCEGIEIVCLLDGQKALPTITDEVTPVVGSIGFRTKSDTVAYFDSVAVEYKPIIPGAQQMVDKFVAEQTKLLGLRIYTAETNGTTRVIASKDKSEVGQAGTAAEAKAIADGTVWFGRENGEVNVTMALHDRNGEFIAAVRVRMKAFFGETEDTAVARARMVVKELQSQVSSAKDLE